VGLEQVADDPAARLGVVDREGRDQISVEINQLRHGGQAGVLDRKVAVPQELESLPSSIGNPTNLQHLDISDNKLESIPCEMAPLIERLGYWHFEFGGNPLSLLPEDGRDDLLCLVEHLSLQN